MLVNAMPSPVKLQVTNNSVPLTSTSPLGKKNKADEPLPNKPSNNDMTVKEIILRGLYGSAACGVYMVGQRALFSQSLLMEDLFTTLTSSGLRAMAMGSVTKAVRESYKKTIPNVNAQAKDIGEAGIINAVETAASYFQEKATAKDVGFAAILGLSSLKSFPNNLMDTQSYPDFIDKYSGKNKLSESSTEAEKTTAINNEKSIKLVINSLAALVTAIPATYLNNEPLTPTNFAKTYLLRLASVSLWRTAMDKAKADAGIKPIQEKPHEAP
ncbi:MAG: hypothetical protein ACJARD_001209 [Alphaproteobacteria bacterium]|jgi:hypothetical protein